MKSRTITFALVLAIILLAVAGVLWWKMRDEAPSSNTNTNSVTVANANRSFGALVVERETTYQDTPLAFTTASVGSEFYGISAGEGKQFVTLFLKPFADVDSASEFANVASRDLRLLASENRSYPVYETKVVTPEQGASYDEGYLLFLVDENASDFSLQFGSGESAETLDLGI